MILQVVPLVEEDSIQGSSQYKDIVKQQFCVLSLYLPKPILALALAM